MPPAGFEPTISAGERPQTYALDRAATGTGMDPYYFPQILLINPLSLHNYFYAIILHNSTNNPFVLTIANTTTTTTTIIIIIIIIPLPQPLNLITK